MNFSKGSNVQQTLSLHDFWRLRFALVANTVLYRLGTCNGFFPLGHREFGIEHAADGIPWYRQRSFATTAEVLGAVIANEKDPMRTLHYGAIFPHQHDIPQVRRDCMPELFPNLNPPFDYQLDLRRPRDFDRHQVFKIDNKNDNGLMPLACPMGEFVIDVDLDKQYDRTGICNCDADKKQVCDTCWALFMDWAQRILMRLLRHMLQFRAMICVYSGRRGFHVWVFDRRAVTATTTQRRAWVAALQNAWRHQPWIYAALAPVFDAHPVLSKRFDRRGDQRDRHIDAVIKALYPKLDAAVSTDATHMHKCVLAPHPVTGNVCVVMFPVDDVEHRFVPSEDMIHFSKVTEAAMHRSELRILHALTKAI